MGVGTTMSRGTASARRPAHLAATKHMHMQVRNALLRVRAVIHNASIAALGYTLLFGNMCRSPSDLADDPLIPFGQTGKVDNMLAWNHQHVHRRLRIDVAERNHISVLEHDISLDITLSDLAKEAVGHGSVYAPCLKLTDELSIDALVLTCLRYSDICERMVERAHYSAVELPGATRNYFQEVRVVDLLREGDVAQWSDLVALHLSDVRNTPSPGRGIAGHLKAMELLKVN
jgi:hypothetical protein